jgi:hypothetical protein
LRLTRSDQVPDDNKSCRYADARLKGRVRLERAHCTDQLQPRSHSPLRIVLVGLRITEIHQHAIVHVFRYKPANATHRFRDRLLVGGYNLAEVFRVHASRERGRADKVGEQHSDLAAFGAVLWSCSRNSSCNASINCVTGFKSGYCAQNFAAIPKHDAKVF